MTTLNYSLPHLPHFVPQGDNANDIDEDPNSLSEATSKALLSNEHSQLSIHTLTVQVNSSSHQNVTYSLENDNCSSSPLGNVDFHDPRILGSLLPLGLLCVIVILGNIMVIVAVKITHKLRGATNLFIVSLAWADLTLGVIVLPFSAINEVFEMWLFGKIWCSIWLAVDVWLCTASILHLVVISLDRYIAVTHPITYPNLMTSKKAKLLIAGAWILSFVICFPPLVGWKDNDNKTENTMDQTDLNETTTHVNLAATEFNNQSTINEDGCSVPQCILTNEPGYVIYSAVGSFYAPMLVMMFFNWRIYRTATKTTKAIRKGWTKVKGVSGVEEGGLGIHRGGQSSRYFTRTDNGSSKSAVCSRRTSSRRSNVDNAFIGNGLMKKDVERVASADVSCSNNSNNKSNKINGCRVPNSYNNCNSCNFNRSNVRCSNRLSSKLLQAPPSASYNNSSATLHRSVSSHLLSSSARETSSLKSPVSHQSFSSTNNYHPNHHHHPFHQNGPNRKLQNRSKSMANVNTNHHHRHSFKEEGAIVSGIPRVSHHQPCPNHVGGRTFSEIGTQTLPRSKNRPKSTTDIDDDDDAGCAERLKKRLRLNRSIPNDTTESDTDDPDKISIDSSSVQPKPSTTSIFRCHPRRWRHQACCFRPYRATVTSKASTKATPTSKSHPQKSSFKPAKVNTTQDIHAHCEIAVDGISDPGSLLNASTDELQVQPMGGVAAMISSVVSQTANVANATAGGKIPRSTTFGKRNIKNQVRRFRMETKAAKTLGIIVGCFICCWFPFFTMYLVEAFCQDCIPQLAFSISFWLGYCNSAINPFIYAAFSRDFRGAFKKIICKVICRHTQEPPRGIFMALHPRNVSLGAAALVMGGAGTAGAVGATGTANNTVGQSSSN